MKDRRKTSGATPTRLGEKKSPVRLAPFPSKGRRLQHTRSGRHLHQSGATAEEAPAGLRETREAEAAAVALPAKSQMTLTVNGVPKQMEVAPWTTLLDALREQLGLTGTKKGCDHGQCGACTVLVDGRRVLSCLTLAIMKDGAEVTTIEGLAKGDGLHALQEAFIEHDAFQCGYCTPGQICSALGLLKEGRAKTPDEIRELMSGNLCRCGAYPNILAAIQQVLQGDERTAKG